ncbi:hypothetical protein CSKR_107472 [Clonorchis sinensis]|uniref:Uncharacterized protein n=1 Tax=Clonorchis sinensis TaxID=79923 RepID=A0A419PY53_CLOSI|nr:hypothetical protein CSKR_107472 [Clonorchis sinensis]
MLDDEANHKYRFSRWSLLTSYHCILELEEGLFCGVVHLGTPTQQLQTIEQESKTLICISSTKLNIHLLLERANDTKRLRQFRNRSPFSRDAKQIYEKTYYSHASSVASTVTPVVQTASDLELKWN